MPIIITSICQLSRGRKRHEAHLAGVTQISDLEQSPKILLVGGSRKWRKLVKLLHYPCHCAQSSQTSKQLANSCAAIPRLTFIYRCSPQNIGTDMSSVVFGNPAERVNWKPSNETRGTWDILSTCVLTMILCVWTAVHLNVPPPGALWALILRKLGWLFMGLIAPELVAASAWYV